VETLNVEPRPDTELMMAVKDGDRAAFALLHERHQHPVLGFFHVLCRDNGVANDLCQETFLRVWQIRQRYMASGPFRAYLFAVARLIWREHGRREAMRVRLGAALPLDEAPALPDGPGHRPDDRAVSAEFGQALHCALDALPEEQRMVFVLRYLRELSLDEIAGALDCPVNTVRSRKILALKKLRTLLAPWAKPALCQMPEE